MNDSAAQLPMNGLDAALTVLLAYFNVKPSGTPPAESGAADPLDR